MHRLLLAIQISLALSFDTVYGISGLLICVFDVLCLSIFSGRLASSVTKSVSVLNLSGKEKSARPPRRLSVPSKSNASSASKSFGNITPISEARSKRTGANQEPSDTPLSDVSKSSNRKKFNVLASASYWLTQIKHSESAGKHSISLGFFKLALEAGCEVWNMDCYLEC